jgi:phosphoglycolate phosphatase
MNIKNIIFDLDGTLVDSADSILNTLKKAFDDVGISPVRPLNSDLIGPPLQNIILELLSESDINLMPYIIAAFKRHYDNIGYLHTQAYDGIPQVLEKLKAMQLNLFIATNKRSAPTKKIINNIGWNSIFSEVYSLDSFIPAFPNKSKLLKNMIYTLNISPKEIVYIGDRIEDFDAANYIGCHFILVEWGYLNESNTKNCSIRVRSPEKLIGTLKNNLFDSTLG